MIFRDVLCFVLCMHFLCVYVCVCLVFFVALDGIPSSCMCSSLIGHFIQNKKLPKERSGGFFKPLFADAKTVEQPQIYGGYGADTGRCIFFQTCLNQHTLATVHETNMPCRP